MSATVLPMGSATYLQVSLEDSQTPANNPVIGETVVAAIRRLSGGEWWDFTNSEWDVVADWASLDPVNKKTLTDQDDGSYEFVWDQGAADPSNEDTYVVTYHVTSAGTFLNRMAKEVWVFEDMALETYEKDLESYEADMANGTKAGNVLVASRSALAGRLANAGLSMTTYRMDGTTPGLLYTLLPGKTGRSAPAQGS